MFPIEATKLTSITGTPWLTRTFNGEIPSLSQALRDSTYEVYLHGFSRFNNAIWTMRWELIGSVAIYMVYAFIPRAAYISAAFIALFFLLLWKGPPYYYEAFVFGALMQEAWTHNKLRSVAPTFALIIGLILGRRASVFLIVTALISWPAPSARRDGWHDLSDCSRTVYGCLMSVPVSRFLQLSPCLFLGRISFGTYLIHVPVLYTVVMAVAVLLWPMSPMTLAVGLLIFAALSVSLGWLMTLAVDEPALRFLSSIRKLSRGAIGRFGRRPQIT